MKVVRLYVTIVKRFNHIYFTNINGKVQVRDLGELNRALSLGNKEIWFFVDSTSTYNRHRLLEYWLIIW